MIPNFASGICAALAVSAVSVAASAGARSATIATNPFLPREVAESRKAAGTTSESNDFEVLDEFLDALRVLQDAYFEPWLGTWPKAIDWTAAVMGTHVAGALSSLSYGLAAVDDLNATENLITTYFSQLLSYYFGQDSFAIRNEAYDDILWVVLGWLELIEFINFHTVFRDSVAQDRGAAALHPNQDISEILRNQTWYGNLWIPAFSHRARVFWDLSERGWNTTLCDGGMLWNPRLEPYKNAITNELYIAASSSMYLYFPGDPNPSPFASAPSTHAQDPASSSDGFAEPHERKHLQAAIDGYRWLVNSGMMNAQGLYTDGFHINGWNNVTNPNTRCDVRNDMVYTYNQGVLLTGQINLWKVTGDKTFLNDGHKLIQSVIHATGYDMQHDRPVDDISQLKPGQLPPWHGLGRAGILEEQCDVAGECSQDSQTFKGIFFHHLTAFCAPLDMAVTTSPAAGKTATEIADEHRDACASYLGWIEHNAAAALATRDDSGKFGMWWTAGLLQITTAAADAAPSNPSPGNDSVDYRTFGVPCDSTWMSTTPIKDQLGDSRDQTPLTGRRTKYAPVHQQAAIGVNEYQLGTDAGGPTDPNTRGRGRTVETQGSGLAVLRSLWEISTRTK